MKSDVEVLIIGMGPVGLLSALLLARQGISVTIVDKRNEFFQESRSIGIHPPLLNYFESIDLLPEMLLKGCKIEKTNIYLNRKSLFQVDLSILEGRNKFLLTLPQNETEKILLDSLVKSDFVRILRNKNLVDIKQNNEYVSSFFKDGTQINSKLIFACDGKNSTARKILGIECTGETYPDFYCMADFKNEDLEQNSANIFINKDGLLESIPLPNEIRRWVIRTGEKESHNITRTSFRNIVTQRKPEFLILGEQRTDLRFFYASKFVAKKFFTHRVILLGDAAHVVSPIGGQGMNLGWIAAIKVMRNIKEYLQPSFPLKDSLNSFEIEHRKLTKLTIRRSENNMSFGRPSISLTPRSKFLKILASSFYKKRLIKEFTMGGVELPPN